MSTVWSFVSGGWLDRLTKSLTTIVTGALPKPIRTLLQIVTLLWVAAFFIFVVGTEVIYGDASDTKLEMILIAPLLLVMASIAVSFTIGALLVVSLLLIVSAVLLPYGPGFSLYAPFVEISVEPVPEGNRVWPVIQLGWIDDHKHPTSRKLQHSKSYDDRSAVAAIVNWIHVRPVTQRQPMT